MSNRSPIGSGDRGCEVVRMLRDQPRKPRTRRSVRIETQGGEPPFRCLSKRSESGKWRVGFLLVAAGIATGVILAGCAGEGFVTSEDLIGTWRVSALDFRQFNQDGSFRVFLAEGNPESSTVDRGRFEIEGTLLTFISSADSAACGEGQRGTYEIEVLEVGPSGEERLRLIHVDDACEKRGAEGDRTLVRLP